MESILVQKVNNIYFKGTERPKPNINTPPLASNPLKTKLINALPVGDKSLAIKLLPPSEFINKADLARYKNIQKKWAESMSKRLGVPVENILARLPEIKAGDAKIMINMSLLALFDSETNKIEISPIRELANLRAKDEAKITHESLHGYLHNLRRAYAKSLSTEQLVQKVINSIETKISEGEIGTIIKNFPLEDSNEPLKLMDAPILSKKERNAFINILNSLEDGLHLDPHTVKLNKRGNAFVREKLLPELTDYSRNLRPEFVLKKMTDYINANTTRIGLLVEDLLSPNFVDLEKNLQIPLTPIEENIAKNSLNTLLSLNEGNIIVQNDNGTNKGYFMSHEEILAREEENRYRLEKVNQKTAGIKAKGLKPAESLREEQRTVKNNLKLLELTQKLDVIEKRIINAPKDTVKIIEINRIEQNISTMLKKNPQIREIYKHLPSKDVLLAAKSEGDLIKILQEAMPAELKEYCAKFVLVRNQTVTLNQKLNTPAYLLADIPKNIKLRAEFDALMNQIKEIVAECDVSSIPKQFFKNEADVLKVNKEAIEVVQKWAKILLRK